MNTLFDAIDAIDNATHALGCGMYRMEYPRRYWWLRLTFRKKQIYREQQELAAWMQAIYGSGPQPATPKWMQ